MASKRRDERGAYSILFAFLAVVLIGLSAFAVDLGNAMARKSDVQGQADFAALSAGGQLTGQTSGTIPSVVLDAVRLSMNENQPLNRNGACVSDTVTACVTSNTQLTNGDLTDGEVRWANGGLQVITPLERVENGFACIFSVGDDGPCENENTDVQGRATVAVFSPLGALPVYAVTPCDYGRQTITDPANGQVSPVAVPPLANNSEVNGTELTGSDTAQIPLNTTGATIMLTGKAWTRTTKVGFFPASGAAPVEAASFIDDTGSTHTLSPMVNYTTSGNSAHTIRFVVPQSVATSEQVWYIRVWNRDTATSSTGLWSDKNQSIPLRVGEPVLECDAGSNDGNFGTLKFPRTDVSSQNDQLAMNMATNLQEPMTLTVHSSWTSSGTCSNGVNGAVTSGLPNPGLKPGTNCVDTDTGLPALAATAGMITGVGSTPGRLTTESTTPGCGPGGSSSNATARIQNTNYSINNDVLSCFLTDGASLATVADKNYSGDAVLDESIYDSPRFFFVPVLHVQPANGGSNKYSIIDFRPAFLTDEDVASSSVKGSNTATAPVGNSPGNGIVIEQNQIKTMKVIFFNSNALPSRTGGALTTYFGVGPRIVRMID
ncbi:pilus assembly protein [Nocardioides guangzhouensis]|uniref:Pilus assembly protein n=1 Tax=Nocardioides guangzhouensis TaxID=2497878 RepID=A0A4V1XZ66_9ACTN|nr:TadE/TadG family type IV pilus assembly protein [Nocardioides guangzhouensis]RYP85679.1 pilus assembly protein [Nocardioides guangzhouensis]